MHHNAPTLRLKAALLLTCSWSCNAQLDASQAALEELTRQVDEETAGHSAGSSEALVGSLAQLRALAGQPAAWSERLQDQGLVVNGIDLPAVSQLTLKVRPYSRPFFLH